MRGRSAPVVSEAASQVSAAASDASAVSTGLAPRETACARPGKAEAAAGRAQRCRDFDGDVVLAVGNREGWPEKHRWTCPSQTCTQLGLFYHAGCLASRPKFYLITTLASAKRDVGEGRGGLGPFAVAAASSESGSAVPHKSLPLALASSQLQITRVVDGVSKTVAPEVVNAVVAAAENGTVRASAPRSGFQSAGGPLREVPSPTVVKTPGAISGHGSVSDRTEDMFNPAGTIISIEDMDYRGSGDNEGKGKGDVSVSTSMSTGQVTASADARGRRDGVLSPGTHGGAPGIVKKRVKVVEYLCPNCGKVLATQDQMEETQR